VSAGAQPNTTFYARAEEALANAGLRTALDRVTGLFGERRRTAFESLEHADLVRDAARLARLRAITTLADHLERFEARLVANGAHVHWAETPDDANRIVAAIAARTRVRRIVKSKSMATEEIHLNAALEREGLTVVETDLGEYIVQLAEDRPSHIIAPIIHMTRQDVGRLMEQRLGVPYSDDTTVLAATARQHLRQEFLSADMGVSGANFGVVESGTIVLVTNEGNGRMVTTLPRIHVALMGIEKLVPTLSDLDRCLKVLARSATGQKLTVYTTLINGPRRMDEADGPDELHVVLLDNGRSGILAGETAEILACIRCGACLNACPIYRNIGGHAYGDTYPGPVGAVLTPGLRGLHDWHELPGASTLCGACKDVCPVRLDIPRMLLALRRDVVRESPPPFVFRAGMRVFAWAAVRPAMYRRLAASTRWLARLGEKNGWIASAPGPAAAWTKYRDLKAPAATTFQERWQQRNRDRGGAASGVGAPE
jgi:L-lactate dehydrogenase complex protein LldF